MEWIFTATVIVFFLLLIALVVLRMVRAMRMTKVCLKTPAYNPSAPGAYVDHSCWLVVSAYENKEDAARLMAYTNARVQNFLQYLKAKYLSRDVPSNEDWLGKKRKIVKHLLERYNPKTVSENDPVFGTGTSYTVDKGKSIKLCLRNRRRPLELIDADLLFFVMMHEIAHIANYNGWGHKPGFWAVFGFLLQEAYQAGYYTPINYKHEPVDYCGIHVAYNPFFDERLSLIALEN